MDTLWRHSYVAAFHSSPFIGSSTETPKKYVGEKIKLKFSQKKEKVCFLFTNSQKKIGISGFENKKEVQS